MSAEQIPEDVMVAARQAIMAEVDPHFRHHYHNGSRDHFGVVQAVAKAIMRERERCVEAVLENRRFAEQLQSLAAMGGQESWIARGAIAACQEIEMIIKGHVRNASRPQSH